MNLRKYISLILLLIAIVANAQKKVVWLHGLQGDQTPSTWDMYQKYFTSSNGEVVKYTSVFNSIKSAANDLTNTKINPNNQDLILVGHSMGGLVSRSIQLNNPMVKGMISAGSPNQGSNLIANAISGNVFNVIEIGVNKSSTAIDKSLTAAVFCAPPVSIIAAPIAAGISTFKNAALGELGVVKDVLGAAITIYSTITPCTQDLLPTSTYIQESQNQYINVPYINIYGAEDYWQVVRIAGAFLNMKKVKDPANMDVSFDETYFPTMYSALSITNQIQTAHNDVYNALVYPAIIMPWIWATRELVLNARYDWDGVYRYIETDMHNNFAGMVGANSYELRSYCTREWVDVDPYLPVKGIDKVVSPSSNSTNGHWVTVCHTSYVPITLEHDGILNSKEVIVPESNGSKIINKRVPGVNHQEMGNQIEMRKLFDVIYKTDTYDKVFNLSN